MEYRLLCDGDGIILTREPELVHGELYISFKGAPDRATAIFERDDGESAYRALSDGVCAIESGWLGGSMKVTVAVLDGSMRAQRWRCERFRALVQKGGGVLIYPYDEDLRKRIVKIQEENADLRAAHNVLVEKCGELEKKLNKLLEGYDVI